MDKITYKSYDGFHVRVFLDRKRVGEIRYLRQGIWQYFPKGSDVGGEEFAHLGDCKQSLEDDIESQRIRASRPGLPTYARERMK
jgi:hypothetical protein